MNQKKLSVAVVDDDDSFARSLERLFRASGFEARTYASAEIFLASTTLPPPDCLVLDVKLGGMSGLDLQRQLRKLGDSPPIIFVTAHDEPGVREQAQRMGCVAYFLKPVTRNSIIEAITRGVEQNRSESGGSDQ